MRRYLYTHKWARFALHAALFAPVYYVLAFPFLGIRFAMINFYSGNWPLWDVVGAWALSGLIVSYLAKTGKSANYGLLVLICPCGVAMGLTGALSALLVWIGVREAISRGPSRGSAISQPDA